jgi:hypothetical protein
MTDKYAELRRLAEAAESSGYFCHEAWQDDRRYSDSEVASLDFQAKASPSTILSLLDELEACRKNDARYRWLRNQEAEYGISAVFISGWERAATCWATTYLDARDLDAAIDAAMQEQKP